MMFEISFLVVAGLMFFVDVALLSMSKLGEKRKRVGFIATITAFCLVMTSYALLLQAFAINDFQMVGVYSYSSSSLSLLSKVYASWAGAGGSMLFLTVVLSVVFLSLRIMAFKKPDNFRISACRVFSVVLIVFIIVCLVRNPFERFSDIPVEGKGLNPQLQTLWMVVHPPIVFSAYAFVVLAYVLTLASIEANRELDSSKLFKVSAYAGWLLLTIGIALGGVWAYEVLGWGGYWAWDPVETASLLPWLFLTAYFIVNALAKSKQSLTRELMILISFASLVFLSALTRGGFTQSVHSYSVSPVGPIMLVFAIGMIGYFFYLGKGRRRPLFKLEVDKTSLSSRASFIGFWALILIAVVCLVGLAFPNFSYNYWTFPFVVTFVLALIGLSLDEKTQYVRLLLITLIALGIGGAISLIGFPNVNLLTTITLPLLFVALSIIIYKVAKTFRRKSLMLLGQNVFNLALIVLLLGVFISAGAKTSATLANVKTNTPIEIAQARIELSNLTVTNSSAVIYNEQAAAILPECSTLNADVTIQQSERTYSGDLSASFYPNYGLVLRPLILTTTTGDLYMHLDYTDSLYNALVQTITGKSSVPEEVSVTVQINPLIYLVWGGVAVMISGIFVQFVADLRQKTQSTTSRSQENIDYHHRKNRG
jgi:cytochrome c-type biogenesis protein CcmF